MKLESRVAHLRKQSGLSQAQLGVFVGVSTNTIQSWEKPNGLTQLEKYLKLGEVLGINNLIDLFVQVEENKDSSEKPNRREFSLEDLRKLRKNWGIAKPDNIKTQKKELENLPKKHENHQDTSSLEIDVNINSQFENQLK